MVEEKPFPEKEAESSFPPKPREDAPEQPIIPVLPEQAKLQNLLDQIIHGFKEKDRHMEISVIRQGFKIQNESVVFFLNGEMQKDIFLKLKPELTGLIRAGLQNFDVEISFEAGNNQETSNKLYTSTDKLLYLSKKSPALQELQKRFGLETDF